MRWLVGCGLVALGYFLWWAVTATHPGYAPLFWLLMLSLGFKLLSTLHEWVHYMHVREPVPPAYRPAPRSVDVLTTACPGEPHTMIIRTLEAMQAIRYPHTSYLCDEGNDPVLRAACARLGVVHVTRELKINAKAGNINNALRQATGELCVILDPDHVPATSFLDAVVPYFEDEQVGYVQVVQAYGNQAQSLVARGAAEQTYHFYGPLMMGMNAFGTVQAIGANCTFRRAALDAIGGHAAGLTEDMHTAMRLHAAGWKSAYVPQVLSKGLVPSSLAAFYSQQLKWSRGAFDLLFRVYPKLFRQFNWVQRLHYLLLPLYFLSGVIAFIDLTLPVLSLGLSEFPWVVSLRDLAIHVAPLLGMGLLIRAYAQRWLRAPDEGGLHLVGGLLCLGAWWVYATGFVYAILGVRVPYLPTPKEGRWSNEWLIIVPNLLLALVLLAACKYGRVVAYGPYTNTMVGLAVFNVALLLAAATLGLHAAVRNFVADMASRPFRGLVLALHRVQALVTDGLSVVIHRFARQVAMGSMALAFGISYLHAGWQQQLPPAWLLNGAGTVHLGQAAPALGTIAPSAQASLWPLLPAEPEYAIVELPLAGTEPAAGLPALAGHLAAQHQVPLLSWKPTAAHSQQPAYWRQVARQVAQVPGPVLLRPLLTAPTAQAARQQWRAMVEVFRNEGVRNAVWAWTPGPDNTLAAFPGVAYVDWLASPVANTTGAGYAQLRPELAQQLELHQLPLLLLAEPVANPQRAARQLAATYPETKAVVFAALREAAQ